MLQYPHVSFHTFLTELVEKICSMITEFFLLTLITFLFDYVLVWLGEN